MRWTVIVPSRDDKKIRRFVPSLLLTHPDVLPDQIVIVSDGLSEETKHEFRDVTWVNGKKPFVYARAVNMGAAAVDKESDLVIANDDITFATPNLIDRLAAKSDGLAAISPEIAGVCGQPAQRLNSSDTTAKHLVFVCIYIPRKAWDCVGKLDERFVGYGFDDVDWCLRAEKYGKFCIDHSLRVHHMNDSSFRSQSDWQEEYTKNLMIFRDKWEGKIELHEQTPPMEA